LVKFSIDIRLIVRQLRMAPGFAAVSILSLALGIGATATVFSVIYGALVAPYPYRGADRMVQVRLYGQSGRRNFLLLSSRQFADFKKLDVLDGAVAMDNWDMASTGDALPEAVRTAHLSADAFAYFGVPPIFGHTFSLSAVQPDEDPEHVVVLGYPYWQRRYGGSKDVVGKQLQLDHQNYTIIGILPPRFRWGNSDVYKPLALTSDPNRIYIVDARLKAGVSNQKAEAEMQPLLEQFAKETPGHFPPGFRVHVASLTGIVAGSLRGTLLLLFAAVGVLLAVGCANVSILFLARGTGRLHEFAVRAALGASRGRLIGQLFTESVLLALAGGSAGILFAVAGVKAIGAWLPAGTFPPEAVIQLNLPVLVFSTAVAVTTGIAFGISPALHFSAPQMSELMRAGSHRTTAGSRSRRMRDLLVACQVALTILLLSAAGSAMRSFVNVYHTKLGYDPHDVLTINLSLPDGNYTTYETRAGFYHAINQRVAALPGARSAAMAQFQIPPSEDIRQTLEIMGRTPENGQTVDVQETTGEYFSTLRIPLLKGRVWSEAENNRAAHVAVINEEMARRFWPNSDVIGQRIRLPEFKAFTAWILAAKDSNGWLEIIGVVGNTPNRGLREAVAPMAYVPYTLVMGDSMQLVIRTAAAPMSMVRAVRQQIHFVDPGQPVAKAQTAEELLRAEGWAREQFVASLFLIFAVLALALAATGLYSVVAYATALRSQEFGIRMALGAQKAHVIGLVLGSAARTVSLGIVVGIALSIACNGLIAHWVPGSVYDPVVLTVIAVLLFGATGLAAFVPARRAGNCDPMQVLRAE
jgi:putative ABC transport system permease protein